MNSLEQADPAIYGLVAAEQERQQHTLNLIASENHATPAVMRAIGTIFTDKYAEGYPLKRYYGGCGVVDGIEGLCIARAKAVFKSQYANVQPHCGTSANLAIYHACLSPGDKILAMDLACGGHLSHGMKLNFSGRIYDVASYGVREDTEMIDMDAVRAQALEFKPKLIVAGASAYSRTIDFAAFGEIARECGALLMADIAHIAGLVVGGVHPSPVGHAQFVSTTNHKTLRGPRGGMILCTAEWGPKIDSAVFPGIQGGPLVHSIAAKAVALRECAGPDFESYARQIVANAQTLAEVLAAKGWRIVSGGTDNHLFMVDLRSRNGDVTGRQAQYWLEAAHIVCNRNVVPFDTRPPMEASGIRLGTPAITTRGLREPEMRQLAEWIDAILIAKGSEKVVEPIRNEVRDLCARMPIPAVR